MRRKSEAPSPPKLCEVVAIKKVLIGCQIVVLKKLSRLLGSLASSEHMSGAQFMLFDIQYIVGLNLVTRV